MIDAIVEWIISHLVGLYNWFVAILSANAGTISVIIIALLAGFLFWSIIDDL